MTQSELRQFLDQADYVRMLLRESIEAMEYREDALVSAVDLIDELYSFYIVDQPYRKLTEHLDI